MNITRKWHERMKIIAITLIIVVLHALVLGLDHRLETGPTLGMSSAFAALEHAQNCHCQEDCP